MRRIRTTAALSATMLALAAPAALAATIPGTPHGDALYGTPYADAIHGYGGADLIYGYGGADVLYGGNESGWGDKILGGASGDRVHGQNGDDALYGDSGNDKVYGGHGADLVQGGYGLDFLDAGPGADRIDARDGQKDTVVIRYGEGDVVYYDRGLDVLQSPVVPQGTDAEGSDAMSVEEAIEAGKKVEVVAEKPPKAVFGHTGKVLIEHEGRAKLVAEKELEGHVAHGDEILDPTGRRSAEEARR